MGLNAAVYKNIKTLKASYGADAFDVEPETGEAMPKPGVNIKEPRATIIALEKRLGNFDGIGKLRSQIAELLNPSESFLLRKVLYSSSHGGDMIKSEEFDKIKGEIAAIRERNSDAAVITFLEQMEELVNVAVAESNPIVFV